MSALCAMLCGCGPADDSILGVSTEAVQNGYPTNDEINVGLVWPARLAETAPYQCSATLVRNNVILTAGHCFQADNPGGICLNGCPPISGNDVLPQEMKVVQHAATDTSIFGAVNSYAQHATEDVAVMLLNGAFTVNGSTLGHSVPIWGGTQANLDQQVIQGKTHSQRGYGLFDCNINDSLRGWDTVPDFTTDPHPGFGARFIGYNNDLFNLVMHIADEGDSGSSFRWQDSTRFVNFADWPIAAISNHSDWAGCPTTAWGLKVSQFRPWAHGKIEQFYSSGLGGNTFTDDYANPSQSLQSYSTFDIGGGPSQWTAGTSAIKQASAANTFAIDNRMALSNGIITTHIYSTNNKYAGVVARYRDPCNFYYLQLNAQLHQVWLTRRKGCVNTHLKTVTGVSFNYTGANGLLVQLILSGKNLYGLVNSAQVIDAADDSDLMTGWLTAGKVGLYSNGFSAAGPVEFKDLSVYFSSTPDPQ